MCASTALTLRLEKSRSPPRQACSQSLASARRRGQDDSKVTPSSGRPVVPRCELKYRRVPSGDKAGPLWSRLRHAPPSRNLRFVRRPWTGRCRRNGHGMSPSVEDNPPWPRSAMHVRVHAAAPELTAFRSQFAPEVNETTVESSTHFGIQVDDSELQADPEADRDSPAPG